MHQLIGHHQVRNPIDITLVAEVLIVRPAEACINAVVMVHHASNSVESKTIYVELLQIVRQVAEQKSHYFVFAVVENHAIPRIVIPFGACMRITMICSVEAVYTIVNITGCMRVYYVYDNSHPKLVGCVDKSL